MTDDRKHALFLKYYGETKDKVFTYLMVRLKFDRATSEDLLMDIVLKAYESFDRFDSQKGTFSSWVFRIAHNHLVNYWRDRKDSLPLDEEVNATTEIEIEPTDSPALYKVLALLSDAEREIIILRYLQDLSTEEIAEMTGKNPGAVRTGLSRALHQFKTFYTKLYGQP